MHEVLHNLNPQPHEVIVDGTLGGGGYTQAILQNTQARVIGIDQDPQALERARPLESQFPGRFQALHGSFGDLDHLLDTAHVGPIDGFVADLGFSSDQMDDPQRGFSFMHDGPLDMRMNPQGPLTAADLVNTSSEAELTHIIKTWGEEPAARRIARAIVHARQTKPLERTGELRDLIVRVLPQRGKIHPATLTFQALRMAVNREMEQLHAMLRASTERLAWGGRLVVVSFHSLEDRAVKHHIRSWARPSEGRLLPGETAPLPKPFFLEPLHKEVVRPQPDEIARNPRARSARLRAAIKRALP